MSKSNEYKCEKCGKIIVGNQRWKAHQKYETNKKEILARVYAKRKAEPEKYKAQEKARRDRNKADRELERQANARSSTPQPTTQPQPQIPTSSPAPQPPPTRPTVAPDPQIPTAPPLAEAPPLPSQAPPVEKASFTVETTPEQEALPEFEKPRSSETIHTPQHTEKTVDDAFSSMFDAIGGMWNQFLMAPVTGGLERFQWTKGDSQRFSLAITLLDDKYHFGAKAAETWLPEIMLAMAIISFSIRAFQGARAKARESVSPGQSTTGTQANNDQPGQPWVPPFHVQSEIDKAFKNAQDRG